MQQAVELRIGPVHQNIHGMLPVSAKGTLYGVFGVSNRNNVGPVGNQSHQHEYPKAGS